MIKVKCFGHIKSSLGAEEFELDLRDIASTELLENLREMGKSDPRLGFTKFNTLLVLNDGEVYNAAADDKRIHDGDSILLLPFSHGG